jgi:hypothetical protein
MKLSPDTLTVLQNFSKINSGLQFKEGNVLRTVSSGKTVLAKAVLKDAFPQDFCVYDLNQFLVIYNLNKDTELDFDDSNVIFKSTKSKTKYRKTAQDMIVIPPENDLKLPTVDISFSMTEAEYSSILKAASILQSPHVAVESDGDKIMLTAFDAKNDSAHNTSLAVGEGNGTKYRLTFSTDNLKMIPGSYDVEVSSKGISHFKNKTVDIQYWIALESKFTKYGE